MQVFRVFRSQIKIQAWEIVQSALFNPAFLRPVDRLCIVSGYASAAMGFHHLQSLKDREKSVKVSLIYGMTKADEDIARYGRSTIDFYKIDDENYFLDFKRPLEDGTMPMAAESVSAYGGRQGIPLKTT